MKSFDYQLTQFKDKVIMTLKGDLSSAHAMKLRYTVEDIMFEEKKNLTLDISKVDGFDLGSLNILISMHAAFNRINKDLHILINEEHSLKRLLHLTKMHNILSISESPAITIQ